MQKLQREPFKSSQGPVMLDEDLRHRLLEMLLPAHQRSAMTYDEFLEWADEDTLAEWVASPGREVGRVIMTTPASRKHQEIGSFLDQILSVYAQAHDLGIVIPPPFQMKLAHSGREPDLLFVAKQHLNRLKEAYLDGPADLVVEIISPESVGRDRGEKFYEYEEAAILEYWLINPQREQAEFYQLDEKGRYRLATPDASAYISPVLRGFELPVDWLWHIPQTLDALRALGLV